MCHERWKRNRKVDTVVTLDKLERNVRRNQSLDDNVVTHRVMDVADYPSAIKCGISFVVVSH
jgi:hypothetical protein